MKIFASSWLPTAAVAGLLIAASSAAASPLPLPTPVAEVLRVAASDHLSVVAIQLPFEGSQHNPQIVEAPRHGVVELQPGLAIWHRNEEGYIGRDSWTFFSNGALLRVELRILPRHMPFAGRFDGAYRAAALWDNKLRTFLLCGEPAEEQEEMTCERVPVSGLGAGAFIPVVWPARFGQELPALFDPPTGRLLSLVRSGPTFEASWDVETPAFPGGWPVLGDFFGDGQPELAMVDENGGIFFSSGKKWLRWPDSLQVPEGDGLVWPIVWPGTGGDVLALSDPAGFVRWRRFPPAGVENGTLRLPGNFDRRPLGWNRWNPSGSWPYREIYFLEFEDGDLMLKRGRFSGMDWQPSTIPVKFPDDPPGGGGGGG